MSDSRSIFAVLGWLALALATVGIGPCGPIPGGGLGGSEFGEPVKDWTFVNDVPRCAVEVRPADPHSVTVNCMSWEQRLFVSCSSCEGKTWSAIALAEPEARIRIGSRIYPVELERVEGAARLDAVWRARGAKLGNEPEPRPDGWWTFELRSR